MAASEPAWVSILAVLRDSGGQITVTLPEPAEPGELDVEPEDRLVERLVADGSFGDVDPDHVADMQTMLENGGLVETATQNRPDGLTVESASLRITAEGFQVLHDREMRSSQHQINRSIVVFTVTLVLVGIAGHVPGETLQVALDATILLFLLGYVWVVRPAEFW
ncbi:MAG: hypothetical protein ABEJ42_02370 [Halobacteriaceae archaeon]